MKKILLVLIPLIIIIAMAFLFFNNSKNKQPVAAPQGPMTQETALAYVKSWAQFVNAMDEYNNLKHEPNGDFYGFVGSPAFEYIATEKKLVVRSVVVPFGNPLLKRPDIFAEVQRIAMSDPTSVANAQFDFLLGRWQERQEPSLYLRQDFTEQGMTDKDFLGKISHLRDIAYTWHRNDFDQVTIKLNKQPLIINNYLLKEKGWKPAQYQLSFQNNDPSKVTVQLIPIPVNSGSNSGAILLDVDWQAGKVLTEAF